MGMNKIFFIITLFLVSCTYNNGNNRYYEQEIQQVQYSFRNPDEITVSRASVARMIAYAIATREVIYGAERYLIFYDVYENSPYMPYINFISIEGIMIGDEGNFYPDGYVTLIQASYILNRIGANINLSTEENREVPISLAAWNSLFLRALENIDHNIISRNIVVVATNAQNEGLNDHIVSNEGIFRTNINASYFLDTEIEILSINNDLLTVLSVITREPTLNFVRVNKGEGYITANISGALRFFKYEGEFLSEVATITIKEGTVLNANFHTNYIESPKILRVTPNFIELYNYGKILVNRDFKPYPNRGLIIGSEIANFFIEDEKIVHALIHSEHRAEKIRVAINTTNFNGLIHDTVSLRAGEGLFVNGENIGNSLVIDISYSIEEGERLFITSPSLIEIVSISRQQGTPSYRGSLEIVKENGGFIIVNELYLEEYLYGVLPSEMPMHFGLEALKLQAVTARSFAHVQIMENRFAHLGANLEDSVMSQVYNNVRETELATRAVNYTEGQVLMYDGRIISANFFSTSSGVTANSGEVWLSGWYWGETPIYRSSVRHYHGMDALDLSIEENARAFFTNWEIDSYDNNSPWFRWRVTLSNDVISQNINSNILNRFNASPNLVRTKNEDGVFVSKPISSIGSLTNIEVIRRGEGGNVMELLIQGTENIVKLLTEFNIRSTISLQNTTLERISGSNLTNFSMLPSGFFTIERLTDDYGNILYVRFIGGGFGHGVGMSQYGARGKIERGYSYRDVLKHFYRGVSIERLEF